MRFWPDFDHQRTQSGGFREHAPAWRELLVRFTRGDRGDGLRRCKARGFPPPGRPRPMTESSKKSGQRATKPQGSSFPHPEPLLHGNFPQVTDSLAAALRLNPTPKVARRDVPCVTAGRRSRRGRLPGGAGSSRGERGLSSLPSPRGRGALPRALRPVSGRSMRGRVSPGRRERPPPRPGSEVPQPGCAGGRCGLPGR